MTRWLFFACVAASTGMLSAVYFQAGDPIPGAAVLVIGIGWAVGAALGWKWVSAVGLLAAYGFAGAGFLLRSSMFLTGRGRVTWLISAALLALLAWDLGDFADRLRLAAIGDDVAGIERRHYLRLAAVTLTGAALMAAALNLRVQFSFEWSVILVLLGIWGIGRVVRWLLQRKQ